MRLGPKIISVLLLLLCSTALLSKSSGDTTFTFKYFTLRAPCTWSVVKRQGVDSYVGAVTNGTDTLEFDYGIYSMQPERTRDKCRIRRGIVGGRIARIARQQKPGQGMTAIFFKLSGDTKFVLYGIDVVNESEVLKIMKSVRFKKSR